MTDREPYWPHSDPEPPAHGDDVRKRRAREGEAADDRVLTTDRDGYPHTATPAGHVVQVCPGRHPEPVDAAPVWCRACALRIVADLDRIPDQVALLTPGRVNAPRDVTGRHGSHVGSPSPSPAWDTIDAVTRKVTLWEDQLRAHLGHSEATRWEPMYLGNDAHGVPRTLAEVAMPRTIRDATTYLAAHITPLLSSPISLTAGRGIGRMSRSLAQVTGTDRLVHRLPGACIACDHKGRLRREDGSETVKCLACGLWWAWDDYQRLAKAYAYAEATAGGRAAG